MKDIRSGVGPIGRSTAREWHSSFYITAADSKKAKKAKLQVKYHRVRGNSCVGGHPVSQISLSGLPASIRRLRPVVPLLYCQRVAAGDDGFEYVAGKVAQWMWSTHKL